VWIRETHSSSTRRIAARTPPPEGLTAPLAALHVRRPQIDRMLVWGAENRTRGPRVASRPGLLTALSCPAESPSRHLVHGIPSPQMASNPLDSAGNGRSVPSNTLKYPDVPPPHPLPKLNVASSSLVARSTQPFGSARVVTPAGIASSYVGRGSRHLVDVEIGSGFGGRSPRWTGRCRACGPPGQDH